MVQTCLRLTEVLARLHVFVAPPPTPPVALEQSRPAPMVGDAALDEALAGLDPASRASVLDPLGVQSPDRYRVGRPAPVSLPFLGAGPTAPARQVDQTTCGSAVLSMLAMAGDPWIALQVARDPAHRFAALQHRVHRACAGTGIVRWPMRLGTAPWAAASIARFGDVRYTHRAVGGARGREVLRAAVAAASSGVPVPLFTGGDLAGGWQAAVPRHVVLLVDVRADDGAGRGGVARVYEPSSATMHAVPVSLLRDPDAATERDRAVLTAALGWWPHIVWAMLPR